MATTADDVWRLLGELAEAQKETERRFQDTERLLKQQNQQLNEQLGKLGNRLGEFVEWQVRPAVVKLFQDRGIAVHEFHDGEEGHAHDQGALTAQIDMHHGQILAAGSPGDRGV